MYKCPVCGSVLIKETKSYKCGNNHNYDISKEGYVNLLLANQKMSKDPGDNKEMVVARRNFLEKDYYKPLVNEIYNQFPANITNILDLGCGEGDYDGKLIELNPLLNLYGIDISKVAVSLASKKYKNINYSIGSTYNLPFVDKGFDIVFSIFSPYDFSEVSRVLNDNGIFILVGPAKNHLKEIAEIIYDKVNLHEGNIHALQSDSQLCLTDEKNISFEISLEDSDDKINLLKMTPYYWSFHGDINEFDKIHTITADFNIYDYKKII